VSKREEISFLGKINLEIKSLDFKALPCVMIPELCQNGGTCTNDMKGGSVCTCKNGYKGEICEKSKFLFNFSNIVLLGEDPRIM